MLLQPWLLLGDRVKALGLELSAVDLQRHRDLSEIAARGGEAFLDRLRNEADDGPPLVASERTKLEQRLARLRELDAPPSLRRSFELELGRARWIRSVVEKNEPDARDVKTMLPLLARRQTLFVSTRAFETLLWLLVPELRRRKPLFAELPSWVDTPVEMDADAVHATLSESPGLRALVGCVSIGGLEPSPHGLLRHLPNVTPHDMLATTQRTFDEALPTDLAALLPEWRVTFPAAYHAIGERFALADADGAELRAYADELRRDADWHFARAMSETHAAATRIRNFRDGARRRRWAVVTTDALDA